MMLRRRGMMAHGGGDPYEGWLFGYRLNKVTEVESSTTCITTYYQCESGSNVDVAGGIILNVNMGIWTYDNDMQGSYYDWLPRTGDPIHMTIPSGRTLIRATLPIAGLDNAYIYDVTNNIYLFKGKNVT